MSKFYKGVEDSRKMADSYSKAVKEAETEGMKTALSKEGHLHLMATTDKNLLAHSVGVKNDLDYLKKRLDLLIRWAIGVGIVLLLLIGSFVIMFFIATEQAR